MRKYLLPYAILETLFVMMFIYKYGFFALLLFGIIHGVLIKKMFELVKMRSPYAFAFTYSYSCFFLFSAFSHMLIYTYSILLFPFWALVFSKTSKI